jgi:hypothetical protein
MTPLIFTSIDEAKANCAYWQKQLRLSDWKIDLQIVKHYEMSAPFRVAEITPFLDAKCAVIRLLNAADVSPNAPFEDRDQELCIVHELLHLHIKPFEPAPGTLEAKMMEVAIESTAQALVRLNRGIQ